MPLSADRLRSLLSYDPETGVFTRSVSRGAAKAGARSGCEHSSGYLLIMVDGKLYRAHRLAWLHVTGEWPAGEVDHINGVRQDNRWGNLRDVSKTTNSENQRRARQTSRVGLLGVSPHGSRFSARITTAGRGRYLGLFPTAEEAHAAYVRAKRDLHLGGML